VFDIAVDDVLYALPDGTIDDKTEYWGRKLFGKELAKYPDKTAFSSGILLFNNSQKLRDLFHAIRVDIITRPHKTAVHDQPYFVYNAFKYNAYNNTTLPRYAINN
jgi:hypothetical protein